MNSHRVRMSAAVGLAMTLLLGISIAGAGSVVAKKPARFPAPDELGAYSIGHTTLNVTDPSRNLDGSTPATSDGRFLHLDIWYPTRVATDEHVDYTWNNPLYNENPGGLVFPGCPISRR